MITPLSNPCAPLKGVEILMMDAQTALDTKSTVIVPSVGIKNHTITLRSSASITGAVQLETAHDPAYTGVWSPLGGGPINVADIGPAAAGILQFQFSNITFGAVRARVTTIIAGGTLSASYLGN